MRSVKGTRRRSRDPAAGRTAVAVGLAVAALLLGCSKAPADSATLAEPPSRPDCGDVVRRPLRPHIVDVTPAATLAAGPACGTATCLAGGTGAFVWRDGNDGPAGAAQIHVNVGGRAVVVPLRPASHLRASNTILGVGVGRDAAVVDNGNGTVTILRAGRDDVVVPLPDLGRRSMDRVRAFDDGVLLAAAGFEDRGPPVELIPFATKAPIAGARAVADPSSKLAGWVVSGENAAFIDTAGVRHELGIAMAPWAQLVKVGRAGLWLAAIEKRKRQLITFDRPPFTFDEHIQLLSDPELATASAPSAGAVHRASVHGVAGFDVRPPGTVIEVRDDAASASMAIESVATLPTPTDRARVQRVLAVSHDDKLLALQRVQDDACNTRDRVFLVDTGQQPPSIRLVIDDDKMRMQPAWAGDRFRFVEGDAEVSPIQ